MERNNECQAGANKDCLNKMVGKKKPGL